jgi:hypothetical protein
MPWIFKRLHTVKLSKDGENEEHFKQIAQALKDAALGLMNLITGFVEGF